MPRIQTVWTDKMLDYLKENIGNMAYDDIALKLGISHTTVRLKAKKLGLLHQKRTNAVQWTDEQIEYLIKNYPTHTLGDLATVIGFSIGPVRKKAAELGLKHVDAYKTKDFYRRYVKKYRKAV